MAHTEVDTPERIVIVPDAVGNAEGGSATPATTTHAADYIVRANPDTIAEVPSAAWGWSGEAPRAFRIAAFVVMLMLLAMLRGNHVGHVEDIFLISFAALLGGMLVRDLIRSRRPR